MLLSIILIILAWNYRQKNKPIVLNLACLLRVIDVKNANAYVIIDDAIKNLKKNIQVLKFIMRQGLERKIIQNG